jgi:hypothetical protein
MNQDQEHLRLLSIFYYVYAGMVACAACFFGLIMAIGIGLLMDPEFLGPRQEDPEEISDLGMTLFCAGTSLAGILYAASLVVAGRSLSQRKHYALCLVLAGFSCMLFPFGTALGVISLIVLVRSSVKGLFDRATPPAYSA